MKLDQFPDNNEIAYKVPLQANKDITGAVLKLEPVTKRKLRQMFQKFLQASPELWNSTRREQIDQFNLERTKINRPFVNPEILMDLEISYTENA